MPARLERCVKKVKRTIVPRDPKQSKESAAYAVCTKSTGLKPYRKKKKAKARKKMRRT